MSLAWLSSPMLVGLCVGGAVLTLPTWRRKVPSRAASGADFLGFAALAASLAVWSLRWSEAGHLPLFGTYESSLSLALAVLVATSVGRLRTAAGRALWPVGLGLSGGLVAHGLLYDRTIYGLTISERSWVVDVHAFVAWAAFGVLAVNFALAGWRLASDRTASESLDRALSRSLSLGFLLHSGMMASGSFYRFLVFGRAWSFDPIEALGLVAWLAYGTLLHMHLLGGWKGRRLALWSAWMFLILVVSYRGIVYFPAWSTYHIFDIDLRIHLTGSETFPGGAP